MPSGRSSPEADAVDAAFKQRVQILYQTLATNLETAQTQSGRPLRHSRQG